VTAQRLAAQTRTDPETTRRLVERTTHESGVPERLVDEAVVARIAELFRRDGAP
jgi:hypothetical protein